MAQEIWRGIILIVPLLLQLTELTFAVLVDPYIRREKKVVMMTIVVVIFSLIVQNFTEHMLDFDGTMPYVRTLVGIYGYSIRPVVLVLLYYIVDMERRYHFAWLLIGVNMVIHLTALFSGVCFRIDSNDRFQRGPLGCSCHIVSGVMLVYFLFLTIREYHFVRKSEALIPLFNTLLIIGAVIVDSVVNVNDCPISFLTITVACNSVFYYIWMHLQFVREHEETLMAEQRLQIMMSQIQPHFLYNTLSTIQALCRMDPEKAFYTTERFGTYLRQNIDSLSQPELIPLTKEIEHTRIYADIEMIRFPNIRIEYDMQSDDFLLPALSVQPLVENAIRHGVRIRNNGVVTIVEKDQEDFHEIVIRDNGKGFDPADAELAEEKHIGIRNVRERIEKMCGGTLTIDSVIGEGTTVTIRIPYWKDK